MLVKLGNTVGEIANTCEQYRSDHVLAFTVVLNPNPDLVAMVPEKRRARFVRELTETTLDRFLEARGIEGGIEHGRTDEYSYNIVDENGQKTTRFEDDAVHSRDLNATILHQLGIDHRRLTFRFQGLDQKLTGVEEEAHVVTKILS